MTTLVQNGADVDSRFEFGSAFESAAALPNPAMMQLLLSFSKRPPRAALDAALRQATAARKFEIMRILVAAGATPVRRSGENTAVEAAANDSTDENIKELIDDGHKATAKSLRIACEINRCPEIIDILLKEGADPNYGLMGAAEGGHVELTLRMLKLATDVNARTEEGRTPLDLCVGRANFRSKNRMDIVRMLLDAGADATTRDIDGTSILRRTLVLDIAKLLVAHGADMYLRDHGRMSPIRGVAKLETIYLVHGPERGHPDSKKLYDFYIQMSGGVEQPSKDPTGLKLSSDLSTDELFALAISETPGKEAHIQRHQAANRFAYRSPTVIPFLMEKCSEPEKCSHKELRLARKVFAIAGPEASTALPQLEAMLTDSKSALFARRAIAIIDPLHFDRLPAETKKATDQALLKYIRDDSRYKYAACPWISPAAALRLIRAEDAELQKLGTRSFENITSRARWNDDPTYGMAADVASDVRETLVSILRSPEFPAYNRSNAAQILLGMGPLDEKAVSAFLAAGTASWSTTYVGRGLKNLGPEIIPRLVATLGEHNGRLSAADHALIHFGDKSVPHLAPLLDSPDQSLAEEALHLLAMIGKPASDTLVKVIEKRNHKLRLKVIRRAQAGYPDITRALLEVCSNDEETDRVRILAGEKLARLLDGRWRDPDSLEGDVYRALEKMAPLAEAAMKSRYPNVLSLDEDEFPYLDEYAYRIVNAIQERQKEGKESSSTATRRSKPD